jgi:hypothetical protein
VVLVLIVPDVRSGQLSVVTAFGISALALGLPIWVLFSTSYRIADEILHVRSGPFTWTIPLAEIKKVEQTRSKISSPALSLDRIAIHYGNGKTLNVSPADRKAFLEAIGQRGNST